MACMDIKKELRKKAKEKRDSMDREEVSGKSALIAGRVISHPWFINSNSIFVYVSVDNEVETRAIIKEALDKGKMLCVPRVVDKKRMEAVPIKNLSEDLEPGFFNILEPKSHLSPVPKEKIDLVIVPGLLFDRDGYRIGYGGGYYDMYLKNLTRGCKTIGLAFNNQIAQKLPRAEYDIKVMIIITETEMIGD